MSDALYLTRLRWDGRSGVSKINGLVVALTSPPDLGAGPVHAVDYIPCIHLQLIQPRACDPVRDWMSAEEIAGAERVLAGVTYRGSAVSR
jgi:hypothetical protein